MATMQIRAYRDDDLSTLRAIMVAAFDGVSIDQNIERQFGGINGRDWSWRKGRHLDADVQQDQDGIFVGEVNGKIVGFISTWCDKEAGIGHIPNLALAEGHRGHGLGRQLIEHALDHFRRAGMHCVRIETLDQNSIGCHLYTSMGFEEVAHQIHFVKPLKVKRA